ncbi:MAG TPA: class I SAM-dependent methyltransferase [Mucilaginibacter sp.]|jgi:2-polyprenyl-3-methyl-5-hydroxy-6-metoxy-1,4-benzoquinol methylase|nr:class I SAM-dependent methyltransferase [Mucilaginibacter sp.]
MDYDKLYKDKSGGYYYHQREEIMPFIPLSIRSALDVGCGNGGFGAMLKEKRSCQVWGIEPNRDAAQEAGNKLDHVINGLFGKDVPALSDEKFDAIFFNDVLEHLADPQEALDYCRDLLNPGGYVIASIPNVRWYPVVLSLLRYKDFRYENAGVMDKTHLRFFTHKSMVRMFEDAGYKVIKTEGINKNTNFTWFNMLNFLLFKTQEDMKFPQFVIVASI